jgi:hypothetical protein
MTMQILCNVHGCIGIFCSQRIVVKYGDKHVKEHGGGCRITAIPDDPKDLAAFPFSIPTGPKIIKKG